MAAADLTWAAVQVKEAERRVILAGRPAVVDDDMERARELGNLETARDMLPPYMSVLRFFLLPTGVEKGMGVQLHRCAVVPQHCRASVRRVASSRNRRTDVPVCRRTAPPYGYTAVSAHSCELVWPAVVPPHRRTLRL